MQRGLRGLRHATSSAHFSHMTPRLLCAFASLTLLSVNASAETASEWEQRALSIAAPAAVPFDAAKLSIAQGDSWVFMSGQECAPATCPTESDRIQGLRLIALIARTNRLTTLDAGQAPPGPSQRESALAFELFTAPAQLALCSDEQAHMLASLAIASLADFRVIVDHSAVEGGIMRVRDFAVRLLEALAAKRLGRLAAVRTGITPYVLLSVAERKTDDARSAREDAATVASWKRWWSTSAALPRTAWK